ncbi:MAG: LPS translocon maturation chaperone LptM [Nevskiaceae bacterium]
MRYLILLSFFLLAGCGQSGDLYLPPEQPEPPAQTGTAAPAETPAPPPTPPPDEKKKEPPKEGP